MAAIARPVLRLALAGLLAGCSSSPSPTPSSVASLPTASPSQIASAIPWVDAVPSASPTPEPTEPPSAEPLCPAADLALVGRGWTSQTGPGVDVLASLVNVTPNPCRVEKPLRVDLDAADGQPIVKSGAAVNPFTAVANEVAMPGGGSVETVIGWQSWCATPLPRPTVVRLTLAQTGDGQAGSTVLTAPINGSMAGLEPGCVAGIPNGTGLAMSPFTAPEGAAGGDSGSLCGAQALRAYSGQ